LENLERVVTGLDGVVPDSDSLGPDLDPGFDEVQRIGDGGCQGAH